MEVRDKGSEPGSWEETKAVLKPHMTAMGSLELMAHFHPRFPDHSVCRPRPGMNIPMIHLDLAWHRHPCNKQQVST
jgi:hypothetical protein